MQQWIESWINNKNDSPLENLDWSQLCPLTAWYIWKVRCLKCFQNIKPSSAATISLIHSHIKACNTSSTKHTMNRNPNPSHLTNIQVRTIQNQSSMLCYSTWKEYPTIATVVIVMTDENGDIKGERAFNCRVDSLQQSNTLGALATIK